MAGYNTGTKYSGNKNAGGPSNTEAAKGTVATTAKVENVFTTGMWLQEKGPALASVQIKEDITLPAGAYINLYDNRADKKSEAHPDFKVTVRPGKLKARA